MSLPRLLRRGSSIEPFDAAGREYELYEDEDAFVLTVELPGFDPEDIDVRWRVEGYGDAG